MDAEVQNSSANTQPEQISKNEEAIVHAGVTTDEALRNQQHKRDLLAKNKDKLLQYVRDNIVGSNNDTAIQTPYGEKPLVYADYTASGKSLRFIEEYIEKQIMPLYANTHTLQSCTGKQTTRAREEARAIVKRVCGADEGDVCIFTGSGSTHATNLLIDKLRVKEITEQVVRARASQEEG